LENRTLLSFLAPANYGTGGPSNSLAVADLNGDGVPDVVTGNSDGTVSVLLGNGDGAFQAPVRYAASDPGEGVKSVAVGDLNGDGTLDLVTANQPPYGFGPGDLSVLLGNGDGTFQPAVHFSPGLSPGHVAVGDLNHDGNLDLVVGRDATFYDGYASGVSVLLGNGDGSFRNGWTYDFGLHGPDSPVPTLADFNGDGNLDLAVLTESTGLSVFLANGDGTFQAPRTVGAGQGAQALAVGDVNGDGIPDLAVADHGDFQGNGSGLSILLGNGDGSFQPATHYDAGPFPTALALGDLNGDNQLDVVVANSEGSAHANTVSVLLGNGDGSFQPAQSYDAGGPSAVAVVDLNDDGILDLVTLDSADVCVRLGNGDGSFPGLPKYDTGLQNNNADRQMVSGDFNGDGIPDLALAQGGSDGGPLYGTVSVLLGNGDGTFQAPLLSTFSGGGIMASLAVGDVNGDGRLDLIVETNGTLRVTGGVSVLLGNGDGTFRSSFYYPHDTYRNPSVAVGDFNGDHRLDLAATNLDSASSLSVFLGYGDGTFQSPQDYPLNAQPIGLAVADLNQDGRPDLVTANSSRSVSILLGNGNGTFQAPQTIALNQTPSALAVGELNGDGTPDLVLSDYISGAAVDVGGVTVLLGNGDGTFQAPVDSFAGNSIYSLAIRDFNQDGRPDLAVGIGSSFGGAGVSVLLGNGDGTFQSSTVSYGTGASVGAVADFNGDGFLDVATYDPPSTSVSVLINAADWPAPAAQPAGPGRGPLPAVPLSAPVGTPADPVQRSPAPAAPVVRFAPAGNALDVRARQPVHETRLATAHAAHPPAALFDPCSADELDS
jgi:hypothetical protein